MKILILCTGNSCRSQMAHGFLQSFDKNMDVFSAGTKPAEKVNPMVVKVMSETGIDLTNHTPKNVSLYLEHEWDYVITVCGGANKSCPMFTGKVKNRLHIGFDDPSEVINGKTNCSLFTKHFVPNSDLLTQNKMCTLPSLNKI